MDVKSALELFLRVSWTLSDSFSLLNRRYFFCIFLRISLIGACVSWFANNIFFLLNKLEVVSCRGRNLIWICFIDCLSERWWIEYELRMREFPSSRCSDLNFKNVSEGEQGYFGEAESFTWAAGQLPEFKIGSSVLLTNLCCSEHHWIFLNCKATSCRNMFNDYLLGPTKN